MSKKIKISSFFPLSLTQVFLPIAVLIITTWNSWIFRILTLYTPVCLHNATVVLLFCFQRNIQNKYFHILNAKRKRQNVPEDTHGLKSRTLPFCTHWFYLFILYLLKIVSSKGCTVNPNRTENAKGRNKKDLMTVLLPVLTLVHKRYIEVLWGQNVHVKKGHKNIIYKKNSTFIDRSFYQQQSWS